MPKARHVLGAAAGAVALAFTPLAAGTASALPAYEDCATGQVCVYNEPNGVNWMMKLSGHCHFENLGSWGLGDHTESAANFSDKNVYLLDWSGSSWLTLWAMKPGEAGNMPPGAANKADAVQICA